MGKLSDSVRADLQRIFALGFLEAGGVQVRDDDVIYVEDANIIKALAELVVSDDACDKIATIYLENPQAIHKLLYETGRDAALRVAERWTAQLEDGITELMDLEG